MKKLISLTVVFVLLCSMTVIPVAFAETTPDNAYEWMDLSRLPSGSGSQNYGSYISYSYRYKADGTNFGAANVPVSESVAVKLPHSARFVLGNMDFGTKAPTSFMMTVLTDIKVDTTVRIYAFPVGTTTSATKDGAVTLFTLPDAEEASTDATSYIIGEFARKGGASYRYDLENGATGLVDYEIKLDASKTARLIDAQKASNPWCVVITGISGTPALNRIKFKNDDTLDAYTYQSAWLNHSGYANINSSEGIFGVNASTKDVEWYIDFDNVSFDTTAEGEQALAVHYAKISDYYAGDLSIEIDKNKDGTFDTSTEQVAVLTPVSTDNTARNISHYVLLDEKITGTYDMRIRFTNRFMARVFGFEFHMVNPETDVYGAVTATDNGDDTYTVSVPVNKSYIKGANKYIVALYNVDGDGKPTSLSKITTPVDFTVATNARTDYGFDSTLATMSLSKEEVEGKYIKAFLWKDFSSLVPLTPASTLLVSQ